jgi:hypothetical protein
MKGVEAVATVLQTRTGDDGVDFTAVEDSESDCSWHTIHHTVRTYRRGLESATTRTVLPLESAPRVQMDTVATCGPTEAVLKR